MNSLIRILARFSGIFVRLAVLAAVITVVSAKSEVSLAGSLQFQCESYFRNSQTIAESVERLKKLIEEEEALGVPEFAQTRFHTETDPLGNPKKTPIVVVMNHGLYNHPGWMKPMEELLGQFQINFINKRSPGHYEWPRSNLDKTSKEDFVEDAKKTAEIASGLGEKIVFVGHSTGGLQALFSAIQDIDRVAGLIGFSAALRVKDSVVAQAERLAPYRVVRWLNNTINVVKYARRYVTALLFRMELPSYRYISIPIGVEVARLGEMVLSEIDELDEAKKEKLRNLPVLFVDIENDDVIDFPTNLEFMEMLNQGDHIIISKSESVPHKHTASSEEHGNSAAERIFNQATEFLSQLLYE